MLTIFAFFAVCFLIFTAYCMGFHDGARAEQLYNRFGG